jgi:anti-sigma-K factor RskA
MSGHEQFAEDLALYALGALEGAEKVSLETHLQECASCRRELEELRGDATLLAFSASGPRPPERAKARLLQSMSQEPRAVRSRPRVNWWAAAGWIAAAAMLVFVVGVSRQNTQLHSTIAELSGMIERDRASAEKNSEILQAPDAASFEVLPVSLKTPPPPAGRAIYSKQRNALVFIASNLHALPSEKAYELWLIPVQGAPIPAGVFKPDAQGHAVVTNPPLPPGVEAKAFAITIEPEQGSSTPTLPIVMMGAGS